MRGRNSKVSIIDPQTLWSLAEKVAAMNDMELDALLRMLGFDAINSQYEAGYIRFELLPYTTKEKKENS